MTPRTMYCILPQALGLHELDLSRDPAAAHPLRLCAGQRWPTLPPCGIAAWRRIVLRTFDAFASRRTADSALVWSHTTSGDGHGQILGGLGTRCTRYRAGAAVHRLQVTWHRGADRPRAIIVVTARRSRWLDFGACQDNLHARLNRRCSSSLVRPRRRYRFGLRHDTELSSFFLFGTDPLELVFRDSVVCSRSPAATAPRIQ